MTSRLAATVPVDAAHHTDTRALETYEAMLILRRFQEKVGLLVAMGLIAEPPTFITGREPALVAIAETREPGECIVAPAPESVLLALALGTPAASLFAEVMGGVRADTAMSDLISAPSASAALAVGLDRAANATCTYLSLFSRNVDACDLERSLAAAAADKSPLVTVLGIPADDTSTARSVPVDHEAVDGLDVARVGNAVAAAARKTREGGGPALIVVRTPLFQGHVVAAGRASGAKGPAREESDPLARLRSRILEDSRSNEAALKSIERTVREAIAKAASDARGAAGLSC